MVGVIANLAVYFALHTLFAETATKTWGPAELEIPVLSSVDPVAVGIAVVAGVLTWVLGWSVLRTRGVCTARRGGGPGRSADPALGSPPKA